MSEWRERRALEKAQDAANDSVPKQNMPLSQRNVNMIQMGALEEGQEAESQQLNLEPPSLNNAQWEINRNELNIAAPRMEYDLMQVC